MTQMKKDDKVISYCALLVFLTIPIYHLWKDYKISETPSVTLGVVDNLYYAHYLPYFSYTYKVNGKRFKGSEKRFGRFGLLKKGDTIIVNYDFKSPDISKPYIRK